MQTRSCRIVRIYVGAAMIALLAIGGLPSASAPPTQVADDGKPSTPAAAPDPIVIADDFRTDTRSPFAISGPTQWEVGSLLLSPTAKIVQTLPASPVVEMTVEWEFPQWPQDAETDVAEIGFELTGGDVVVVSFVAQQSAGQPAGAIRVLTRRAATTPPSHGEDQAPDGADTSAVVEVRRFPLPAGRPGGKCVVTVRHGLFVVDAGGPASGMACPEIEAHDLVRCACTALGSDVRLRKLTVRAEPGPTLDDHQRQLLAQADQLERTREELSQQEKLSEALAATEECVRIRREILGEHHFAFADSLNSLAAVYYSLGDYAKAQSLFQQSCDIFKPVIGETHPDYAHALHNLAFIMELQGDPVQAEPLYAQVLEIRKQVLGENHPDYATSLDDLARMAELKGDYTRAEQLYEQAVRTRKAALGDSHPDYATSLHNLAVTYSRQAKYAPAESILQQVLEIRRRTLGVDSREYAVSLGNLGSVYRAQGKYAEAEPLYQQALEITKRVLGEDHPDYVTSLSNMASFYAARADYAKAEPLLLQTLEITKRTVGEEHRDYALSLSNLAHYYQSQSKYAQAESLYRQAADVAKRVLGENHPDYATILNNLAVVYDDQGDYAQAEPCFRQALEIRKQSLGEDHPDYASSLNDVADIYQTHGDYTQAESLYRQALETMKRAVGETHPDYATSLNHLASLYDDAGDYARARSLYQQALDIRRQVFGGNHPTYAISLNNLAFVCLRQGDYDEAERLLKQALEIKKQVLGEQHEDYATSLNNLAGVYDSQNDFAKAEPLYLQALEIRRQSLGEKHPEYALSLNNLAWLYDHAGAYAKAEPLYMQALDITREALGENHPEYASRLNNLAFLYEHEHQHAKAEPLYVQALGIWKRVFGEDHPDYAIGLNNLALLYDAQGEYAKAEPLFRQALAIRRRALGETHPGYAETLLNLAVHCAEQQHQDEALQLARAYLRWETEFAARTVVYLSEARALSFRESLDGCHLLLHVLRTMPSADAAEAYLGVWNSRGLVSRVLSQRRRSVAATPEAQAVLRELQLTAQQLARLTLAVSAPEQRAARQQRLAELNDKKEQLEESLARLSREFRRSQESASATPQDLARLLAPHVAVVEFRRSSVWTTRRDRHGEPDAGSQYDGSQYDGSQYDVFVLRPVDQPPGLRISWIQLGPAQPIDAAVAAWRAELLGRPPEKQASERPDRSLRTQVWQKIEPHLAGCTSLVIIPDGNLCFVPWPALPGRQPQTVLLEEYAISTVPSGQQLLAALTEPNSRGGRLLVAGGISYDGASAQPSSDGSVAGHQGTRAPADMRPSPWIDLPGTRQEIEDVIRLWPGDPAPVVLQAAAANEASLRQLLPGSRYVHLATHGFFADEKFRSMFGHDIQGEQLFGGTEMVTAKQAQVTARNPLILSGLVLSGANLPPQTDELGIPTGEDGVLTAEEIVNLDLRGTELAVLSACETGLGAVAGGEGVVGLTRAFHLAGTRNAIASLWKVDDQATAALMRLFYYKLWHDQQSPIVALREAQLAIYRNPDQVALLATTRGPEFTKTVQLATTPRKDPPAVTTPTRHWAAFVLSGPGD